MPPATYLLASLYTTAKTLLHRPTGPPRMNKVFRASWCAAGLAPRRFLRRCAWTFTAPTILHCRFANDRCRNYARDRLDDPSPRFVRVFFRFSSYSARFFPTHYPRPPFHRDSPASRRLRRGARFQRGNLYSSKWRESISFVKGTRAIAETLEGY